MAETKFNKQGLSKALRRIALRKETIEFQHPNPSVYSNWPKICQYYAESIDRAMFAMGDSWDVRNLRSYEKGYNLYAMLTGHLYGDWESLPASYGDHGPWTDDAGQTKPMRQQAKYMALAERLKNMKTIGEYV